MKFKYKVLIINIIILSFSIGITGFFMIRSNFRLTLNALIENAVVENSLAQSYVEYELLDVINDSNFNISSQLKKYAPQINDMLPEGTALILHLNDHLIYQTITPDDINVPESLLNNNNVGEKLYIIENENGNHSIYVTSYIKIGNDDMHIITRNSVEEAYEVLSDQIRFFRIVLLAILAAGGTIVFIASSILTSPLESLNKISEEMVNGNYKLRAEITSRDEIGELTQTFNQMADSVDGHVRELEAQVKRREQFVADFTHEIKTPMTTIIGYADTMRSVELPREEQINALNYIFAAGKRMEKMSGKLFELIYLNNHNIDKAPINAEIFSENIKELVEPMLSEKRISLVCDFEKASLTVNKDLMETAIINFIDNARKASSENSVIYFTGKNINNGYTISVKDEGIGIKSEHLDKICDEFYMVDKSRSRTEGSAGLGLSLSALIIARHNARMKIESEEGKGTIVSIIFESGESNE